MIGFFNDFLRLTLEQEEEEEEEDDDDDDDDDDEEEEARELFNIVIIVWLLVTSARVAIIFVLFLYRACFFYKARKSLSLKKRGEIYLI